jgi:hypothetical protein
LEPGEHGRAEDQQLSARRYRASGGAAVGTEFEAIGSWKNESITA